MDCVGNARVYRRVQYFDLMESAGHARIYWRVQLMECVGHERVNWRTQYFDLMPCVVTHELTDRRSTSI